MCDLQDDDPFGHQNVLNDEIPMNFDGGCLFTCLTVLVPSMVIVEGMMLIK